MYNFFLVLINNLLITLQWKLFFTKSDLRNFSSLSNDISEEQNLNALKIRQDLDKVIFEVLRNEGIEIHSVGL